MSPATFFRYFPTKEDVVLQDDLDIVTSEALEAQPPELSPIAAFRAASRQTLQSLTAEDLAQFAVTAKLTMEVPEIRARAIDEFVRTINQIADTIARRTGRSGADFEVRTMAGAIIGVVMSVTISEGEDSWNAQALADIEGVFERVDAALAQLERGLPL